MKKKLISMLLCAVMVGAMLTGCGGTSGDAPAADNSAGSTEGGSGEEAEIYMFIASPEYADAINELIDAVFPKIKTSLDKSEILSLAADAFQYKLGENAGFPFNKENKVVDIAYQKADADCVVPVSLSANVKQLHDFLYGNTSYTVTDSVESISDEIIYRTGVNLGSVE